MSHQAYKFRIYPNKDQQAFIHQTHGHCRFVYNHFLALWNTSYEEEGKGLNRSIMSKMLTKLKKQEDTAWLRNADSVALQASYENLIDAFQRFFQKQNNYPRFKSKKNPVQSYTTKNTNNNIAIVGNQMKLPKLGLVKFAKSRDIEGRILKATIKYNASGTFYVSVQCEVPDFKPLPQTNEAVGIDLGIPDFAILSTGRKVDNQRFTKKMEQKLKREQRKLSRRYEQAKKEGRNLRACMNYQKQRRRVARLRERVAFQREDFLNKLSTALIRHYDVICIENLNTKGMLKNHKLAKAIADVSWSEFVTKLKYKAKWLDRKIVEIDRFFPSSQLCHACGHRDGKKPLAIRVWTCSSCGTTLDRDINASKNILIEGLRLLKQQP
ncbi:transposase [Kurthia sp. 3B1D]|uniref:Transposase n=1 Tax=Candidatus Kurthia intestinigallinarum TaxID=1562256 RepID=A0A433RWB6_9BACL|nr:IS200/IS605 family element RNA-guided endonuclease TnpB [Kurthia sp. 3B1D]RUS57570.1 transposase [Kurthia sp. 3B1D]